MSRPLPRQSRGMRALTPTLVEQLRALRRNHTDESLQRRLRVSRETLETAADGTAVRDDVAERLTAAIPTLPVGLPAVRPCDVCGEPDVLHTAAGHPYVDHQRLARHQRAIDAAATEMAERLVPAPARKRRMADR